jgi:hypothetical protein
VARVGVVVEVVDVVNDVDVVNGNGALSGGTGRGAALSTATATAH